MSFSITIHRGTRCLHKLRLPRRCQDVYQSTLSQGKPETIQTAAKENLKHEVQDSHVNRFAKSKIGTFFQEQPKLGNQYLEDVTLKKYLRRTLPGEVLERIEPSLERLGSRVAGELQELGHACEREPPRLEQYHAWGRRVDRLVTSAAWRRQKQVSAEEGLVATAYQRESGPWSRLHQMAKVYLYCPSSGLYSCPLAMTDGAARIIESLGNPKLVKAYAHLTTTDPDLFWTSGQWMTERQGGSDVGAGTETVAVPQEDGSYRLYGHKWFSSATDSDMTFTLARILDQDGEATEGSRGLSMFYLETRDAEGNLNGIEVQRLKDKLGTRQLPTAELLLDGCKAMLVSDEGRGVSAISTLLTVTRMHNALVASGYMRRLLNLARDYSLKRRAFGSFLSDHNLHVKTLANMEIEQRGSLLIALELARLFGHDEVGLATDQDTDLIRLLTPIAKLYTAKQAVAVVSEGLECFGGMGYLEDTGLPTIYRDAQVLPIWEGTTNILSLDILRSISKSQGTVLNSFYSSVAERCAIASSVDTLKESAEKVQQSAKQLIQFPAKNPQQMQVAAREFAYSLGRTYIGGLLLEHASWSEASPDDVYVAKRWCEADLLPMISQQAGNNYSREALEVERHLVFDGWTGAEEAGKSKLWAGGSSVD